MNEFDKRYAALNAAQKVAVDTIDGPLMVVAGPGTGKTELLSMRVANILKSTDALSQNILCLTFTESGARAMRERLTNLLGLEAYKVSVHTFHSFGTEIINYYGEYFYQGAHFRPANELSSYETLVPLLETLSHTNPLSSKMNGSFTHLRDVQNTISDLKRSGLTPDEVELILDRNDSFLEWVKTDINIVFSERLSKKRYDSIDALIVKIFDYNAEPLDLLSYHPLHSVIAETLTLALQTSKEDDSTKPLSLWKRQYTEKNERGEVVLKDNRRSVKLRATVKIYYQYLISMQERSLYDFDDMILRVVHAMEVFEDLRLNLQEQYQYILVDEFQDTNDAQMRLLWNLTNNPSQNGRPNLMVVGDDDQAIYRFQGAKISNIIDFSDRYSDVKTVTLQENYRSQSNILDLARSVIVQGQERLEYRYAGINKKLHANYTPTNHDVRCTVFNSEQEQYSGIAQQIANKIAERPDATRAVIARNHRQLISALPYFLHHDISLRYERQEDVLESEPVVQLELLSQIIHLLSVQSFSNADELMPQLLAHPAWGVTALDLWKLSLKAHKNRQFWLETMLDIPGRLKDIAEWIIVSSHLAQHETLEFMIDHLFGVPEPQVADSASDESRVAFDEGPQEDFISPLRAYFFSHDSLDTHPSRFLAYLSSLSKLRQTIREYKPDTTLKLADFINCINLHKELGLSIKGDGEQYSHAQSLQLLTAHRSKGLEFDEVFIVDTTDSIWGDGAKPKGRLIQFPSNLQLSAVGDNSDERLRLFYVALTRAKDHLYISYAVKNSSGKGILPVGALAGTSLTPVEQPEQTATEFVNTLESDWRVPLYDVGGNTPSELLQPLLDKYRLSATHLNNFLDVTKGGPRLFLLQNLLRFPQAMSPSAAYGSAIHGALQRAHAHLVSTKKRRPVEDILHDFEELLSTYQLSDTDSVKMLSRGSEALSIFLHDRYESFSTSQVVEQNFSTDIVMVGDACITGAIDLIDIDRENKTIIVTDYKTGRPSHTWQGKTEYEKIKLHHYEQQLMLYKFLIENSRQFSGYTVTSGVIEFVETDGSGDIILLPYEYDEKKLADFYSLLQAVWDHIKRLDFANTDKYLQTVKGIMEFEKDIVLNIDPT